MLKITYLHTLYKRDVVNYTDKVDFGVNGGILGATFVSGGKAYFIECQYIRSIEEVKEG